MGDAAGAGWKTVAEWDEAATLLAALVDLEPGREYTRSDLAEAADVPLKTLYLVDTLDGLVEAGVVRRVDGDSEETRYVLVSDSPVLAAARQFDDAVASQVDEYGVDTDRNG